jgi:hypothetical protein
MFNEWNAILSDYRYWLRYDPTALVMLSALAGFAALLVGIGIVTLHRCAC